MSDSNSLLQQVHTWVYNYGTQWYSILALLLLGYYTYEWARIALLKRRWHTKMPAALPDIGAFAIPMLFRTLKAKKEGTLLEFARERFVRAGSHTFYINLASVPVLFTKSPKNTQAILATQFEDFALGNRHDFFKPLLGDGIFTLDGAGWKHSRTMLRPQFARDQIGRIQKLEPHVQTLKKHILLSKGGFFDIQELFFKFTVDTSTEFLFGSSTYSLRDASIGEVSPSDFEGKELFTEAFNTAQMYLATRAFSQMFYWMVNNAEFRRSTSIVHKFAHFYVKKAVDLSPEELEKKADGYVFLYELAKETRDPQVLQDQLLNIMIAGRDTTAGLLSFTMYELARNPEVWKNLRAAVGDMWGLGDEARLDEMTFESLKRCDYLKWVLNEVLRMYPSVPMNLRQSTKDTTLPVGGGPDGESPVFIRKGQTVAYCIYATQRDEEYFGEDANVFIPERWKNPPRVGWAYLPFNGGPRICLGQQFALTEASYVVARLAQMFTNLHSGDTHEYPPRKCSQLTMSLQNGAIISLY